MIVLLSQQAPFPSDGRLLAFNGVWKGRPAILGHIYGQKPAPTSVTIPFTISRAKGGAYGTVLRASLPRFSSRWGSITGLSLNLGRSFSSHGKRHTYLSAACPAPKGVPLVSFPFARASFGFAGGQNITSVLTRSCRAL